MRIWVADITTEMVELREENARLRAALADFAEFGIKESTNPVLHTADQNAMQAAYVRYLMSVDKSVRERAKQALGRG
jgi:hypothetical protein